jgi:CBS domain containing-hemolysin-like protein
MISLLITFLIIFINWFFVAAEFALVKVRSSQIDVLIQQGNKKAVLIKHIVDHIDTYLWACQLGITIASLALWWVWEPLVAAQFIHINEALHLELSEGTIHAIAIPVAFFIITTLHIIIGEQVPKTFAIRDPLSVSKIIVFPLYRFFIIFKPLIRLLNILSKITLRLFWVNQNHEEESHSEEELRMIVSESEEDGHINASERELIHNVFDFDNRQVSEIMAPAHKIFGIDKNKRTSEQIKEIITEWYSRIPVYEWGIDNITGWILFKDMVSAYVNQKVLDLHKLIRPIQFVPENMKINDCLKLLQSSHTHIAIVISEYGTTSGLVTMEDILEELVWDIHDEGDEESVIVKVLSDTTYLIDATASISDINDNIIIPLPESAEYDTLAGYINTLFGRIPSVNESITTDNYSITITKRKKQRVDQIKLSTTTREE